MAEIRDMCVHGSKVLEAFQQFGMFMEKQRGCAGEVRHQVSLEVGYPTKLWLSGSRPRHPPPQV